MTFRELIEKYQREIEKIGEYDKFSWQHGVVSTLRRVIKDLEKK